MGSANDGQELLVDGAYRAVGSPVWRKAYAARVGAVMAELVREGSRVLWIGEPAMQDPQLSVRHAGDRRDLCRAGRQAPWRDLLQPWQRSERARTAPTAARIVINGQPTVVRLDGDPPQHLRQHLPRQLTSRPRWSGSWVSEILRADRRRQPIPWSFVSRRPQLAGGCAPTGGCAMLLELGMTGEALACLAPREQGECEGGQLWSPSSRGCRDRVSRRGDRDQPAPLADVPEPAPSSAADALAAARRRS